MAAATDWASTGGSTPRHHRTAMFTTTTLTIAVNTIVTATSRKHTGRLQVSAAFKQDQHNTPTTGHLTWAHTQHTPSRGLACLASAKQFWPEPIHGPGGTVSGCLPAHHNSMAPTKVVGAKQTTSRTRHVPMACMMFPSMTRSTQPILQSVPSSAVLRQPSALGKMKRST